MSSRDLKRNSQACPVTLAGFCSDSICRHQRWICLGGCWRDPRGGQPGSATDTANTSRHPKGRARGRGCPGPASGLPARGPGRTEAAPVAPLGGQLASPVGRRRPALPKPRFRKAGEAERSKGQGEQRA